jgi:hypothetical protein
MATIKDNLFNAIRFHWQLNPHDDKGGKKEDQLRVAGVLKKVLDKHGLDEETKARARWWCAQRASDPQVRQMFLNSTDASIEAFLLLPEEQQKSELKTVPIPMLNKIFQMVKNLQPTLSLDTLTLLEQRFGAQRRRQWRWLDLVWLLIALLIAIMVINA